MKYVITWTARPNVTEEAEARSLQVFSKWVPSSDVTFEQFLGRVDAQGGLRRRLDGQPAGHRP